MKVLVTGANGQLGYDLLRALEKGGHEAIGVGRREMDITDFETVKKVLEQTQPEAVIHCAAYTKVDQAEDDVSACEAVNAGGTEHIAELCRKLGIKMMYISTDYVFNGKGTTPWQPDDPCDPQNVYGLTKYQGELAVKRLLEAFFIVRISWVFGIKGRNFIKSMLDLAKKENSITIVADQVGSPTYTVDLAELLVQIVETNRYGTYHVTNEGFCSWYELACEVFKQAGIQMEVTPVDSSQRSSRAVRPKNSRMSKEKLEVAGFSKLPHWKDAVRRYLKELGIE